MRTLPVAALIALSSLAGAALAQESPQQRRDADLARRLRVEAEILRERARRACPLPDGSTHPLNALVNYEGQTFRCVEVFTPTPAPVGEKQMLAVHMAGWVRVP